MLGFIKEIWRYPVSGLQGESINAARVTSKGIVGDHVLVLRSVEKGKVLDPKSLEFSWGTTDGLPRMLDLKARLTHATNGTHHVSIELPQGETIGTDDSNIDQALSRALGLEVKLETYPRMVEARERSGRALHLLTDVSLETLSLAYPSGDFDLRRFRPNIVVAVDEGFEGFPEDEWVGNTVRVGDEVEIAVQKPNVRCVVTTMRQGRALPPDDRILETIAAKNGNHLGVMCSVPREGSIRVGDRLEIRHRQDNESIDDQD